LIRSPSIRPATEGDLDEIWRIQAASGEAAQWKPADYLMQACLVATVDDRLAGFAVARRTAPDEIEILNVAVDPPLRRRGIGRSLLQELIGQNPGTVFLEVRQSNVPARKLYHSLGFEAAGVRQDYYGGPVESAIVMKFHSC
jgi:[ribosomal protein S18]-alanine N-acetyltransferase